jgi:hypothetical protein
MSKVTSHPPSAINVAVKAARVANVRRRDIIFDQGCNSMMNVGRLYRYVNAAAYLKFARPLLEHSSRKTGAVFFKDVCLYNGILKGTSLSSHTNW